MFLSIQINFSLAIAFAVCFALSSSFRLDSSSLMMAPRYFNWVTRSVVIHPQWSRSGWGFVFSTHLRVSIDSGVLPHCQSLLECHPQIEDLRCCVKKCRSHQGIIWVPPLLYDPERHWSLGMETALLDFNSFMGLVINKSLYDDCTPEIFVKLSEGIDHLLT